MLTIGNGKMIVDGHLLQSHLLLEIDLVIVHLRAAKEYSYYGWVFLFCHDSSSQAGLLFYLGTTTLVLLGSK